MSGKPASRSPQKNQRRRSREIALQALYAWTLAGGNPLEHARTLEGWDRCDQDLCDRLIRDVTARREALEERIAPHSSRALASLSPVERVILLIGTVELEAMLETPFRVVINEAIELGKSFGGTDGHKFVNGVLEKLAAELRAPEIARARASA